jgi:type IV secretory pathway TrbD component
VFKALHRPLTLCGVDRRLFFLAVLSGAMAFNLVYSLLAGLLTCAVVYAVAFSTRHDPQLLPIIMRSARYRARYDPAKHQVVSVRVR